MTQEAKVQNFNNLVAMFLSEAIRSKRTSLSRAAEICHRVVSKLKFLHSETEALDLLTQIENDFEEVATLKQALHFGYQASDVKVYESEIKEYASKMLVNDINLSYAFLQDAARRDINIQQLCLKYSDFCNYLSKNPEKAAILPQFQA